MAELSPVAQAVMDAAYALPLKGGQPSIAAALRAVAAPLVDYDPPRTAFYPEAQAFVDGKCVRNSDIYAEIIAIATELENTSLTPPPNSPLWKTMEAAYFSVSTSEAHRYAAELRAIAKWIEQCAASSHTVSSEDMPTVWRIVGMLQVEAAQAEAEAGE